MPNFNYKIIIVIYMVIMSIIGFASMGIDKKRAINKKWRTPEKTLFIIAFLGGAAGSVLGMHIFKHKTKHMKFVIFMPLFLVLQIAALLFICIVYYTPIIPKLQVSSSMCFKDHFFGYIFYFYHNIRKTRLFQNRFFL